VSRTLQKRKNNGKSRIALFPPNQHDHADINAGIKSLEITDVSYSGTEEEWNMKSADAMKRKVVADGDFGKPIAQSSPVQEYKHSSPDTWQRTFSLQDFIVKGARSGKKKSTGLHEPILSSSCGKESKSSKRINPTRLGPGKSKGVYLFAVIIEYGITAA
jgi:hypothetical protein